jgi:SAM-dependent methyltransferase
MPPARRVWDRIALKVGNLPGYCSICGNLTIFKVDHPNFREHVVCERCGSRNRQRQIASLLLAYLFSDGGDPPMFANIREIPSATVIWNAENTRALHERLELRLGNNYISSEYIDPLLKSGEQRNGVLHVDMQNTHFEDNSIDFILSSDVMEHVPMPLKALKETYRILKSGGCHIFTAPFYHHRFTNEKRAVVDEKGAVRYFRQPWYHDDPMCAEGVLVYTIFAPELLCQLEQIGFEARLCVLYSPFHGILGSNGIVIVARKVLEPNYARDFIFPDNNWATPPAGSPNVSEPGSG